MKQIVLFFMSFVLLAPVQPAAAQITSFLHTQGREVVNDQNEVIKLRGINMDAEFWAWDWDSTRHNDYADHTDIRFLDSLGANVIRLCLNYHYFESSDGYNFIDRYLTWCDTAGIYVLLDMHVVPAGNDIFGNAPAEQQLIDIWQGIASRYHNRAVVMGYDLMNEPWPSDSSLWYNYANRLIDSIRVVDSTHIIMVENTLDGELFPLVNEPNILYSYHDYSPFAVTHAAANWVGDTPMPADQSYPGNVLSAVEWVNWSADETAYMGVAANWMHWEGGPMIVPTNAEYASVKPFIWDNTGQVWFDDLYVTKNGVPFTMTNAGAEDAAYSNANWPGSWGFWTSTDYVPSWSNSVAHSGTHSLSITGHGGGSAVWDQTSWLLTQPLLRVLPGDTLRTQGWIRAPQNNGGGMGIGINYSHGVYEYYDRAHLLSDIQKYLDWSATNNRPIWCGEFGCMSAAPNGSQDNLVHDKIAVMNEAGVGWAMWNYRTQQPPSFSPRYGDSVDVSLTNILFAGFGGFIWSSVTDLTVRRSGSDMILRWSAQPAAVSYTVYSAATPSANLADYVITGSATSPVFVHENGSTLSKRFYRVVVNY